MSGLLVDRVETALFLKSYAVDTSILDVCRHYASDFPSAAVGW